MRQLVAALVLYLVLIQPNHPAAMTLGAFALFPLELPPLLALLMLAGTTRIGQSLRLALCLALMAIVVLKLADLGTFIAFNRGFNLAADFNLAPAAWELLKGSIGTGLAWLAGLALVLGLGLVALALWWAMGVWMCQHLPTKLRPAAVMVAIVTFSLAIAEIGQARRAWQLPPALAQALPGAAFTGRVGLERVEQFRQTRKDLAQFRELARNDPMRDAGPFLDRLAGRDLFLIYIESYGRSSFENPLYRPTHVTTLLEQEAALRDAGLHMRSGWLRAPMVGGQSWLAHGSVATGLWLDTQARYRAMLSSGRQTLHHFAQEAGIRTVAIKPAHIFAWPEGAAFGFDAIYNAADLGYSGEPFNWITMPDQFTFKALERLELAQANRPPVLAQVALVSSHAPWVPVPELVDWEEIGDGTIFNQWALSGDPPEVVWRDHDRVRDQFRLAVDYSLQTVGAWTERMAQTGAPLMVILGDHEPARFVSGVDGYDVPIHIVGPADLVEGFAALGWSEGLIPDIAHRSRPMSELRDILLTTLSSE